MHAKAPCPEMHGFCNFAVFVDEKSRAPEPLLGSFLDVQRYLQNPNSRVVSGIFAIFSRALEPWAVQNIQKGR